MRDSTPHATQIKCKASHVGRESDGRWQREMRASPACKGLDGPCAWHQTCPAQQWLAGLGRQDSAGACSRFSCCSAPPSAGWRLHARNLHYMPPASHSKGTSSTTLGCAKPLNVPMYTSRSEVDQIQSQHLSGVTNLTSSI